MGVGMKGNERMWERFFGEKKSKRVREWFFNLLIIFCIYKSVKLNNLC